MRLIESAVPTSASNKKKIYINVIVGHIYVRKEVIGKKKRKEKKEKYGTNQIGFRAKKRKAAERTIKLLISLYVFCAGPRCKKMSLFWNSETGHLTSIEFPK
jgi:hypothetical protein